MKTLIIDGCNLIHRTWWTAKLQGGSEDDKLLNGLHIHFTLNAIKSYVEKYKPTKTYVCWDQKINPQPSDRKALLEEYKGNRQSDVSPHRNNKCIQDFLSSLGIPSIYPSRLEADDIIAYLCTSLKGSKVIVSVDQDFLQLVSDSVIIYNPIRKIEITPVTFETVASVNKENFLTMKCLVGDKSDNVPGLPRWGRAKVTKYLNGLIQLNEDEQAIFNRNRELFRLDIVFDESNLDELAFYNEQVSLSDSLSTDYQTFIELCKDNDLNSIIDKKQVWYNTFFMQNKLLSLFK